MMFTSLFFFVCFYPTLFIVDLSAYLIYQNTMRDTFRAENPGMTFGQLSKYTASMYSALTPIEKTLWEQAAKNDKTRYQAELAGYVPPPGYNPDGTINESYLKTLEAASVKSGGGGKGGRKKKKDPDFPKRARGPYVFFTLDERPRVLLESPDMKFIDMGHVMGQRWRELPAEEKKRYEEMANIDKKRFHDELAAYNAKHPEGVLIDGLTRLPTQQQQQYEQQQLQQQHQQQALMYAPHPQYQEAQQYAEQYYAHQQQYPAANAAGAAAAQYDPNAAAYAQYYAQQGFSSQPHQLDQEFHY